MTSTSGRHLHYTRGISMSEANMLIDHINELDTRLAAANELLRIAKAYIEPFTVRDAELLHSIDAALSNAAPQPAKEDAKCRAKELTPCPFCRKPAMTKVESRLPLLLLAGCPECRIWVPAAIWNSFGDRCADVIERMEMPCGEKNAAPQPATTVEVPVSEVVAWLFQYRTDGKFCEYASVDPDDNHWWPTDKVKSCRRAPLSISGDWVDMLRAAKKEGK